MLTSVNSLLYSTKHKDLTTQNDVEIRLDAKYNRKEIPAGGEKIIEDTWQERLKSNATLFNGTKFRLDSIEEENSKLILNLGVTSYKDFQGTNRNKDVLDLQSKGLCDHDNSQAYMSDALGVGALVLTKDDFVVLLFRSTRCGEDTELWDRPGGHPEPKVLVGSLSSEEIDLSLMDPKAVLKELFDCIISEVIDEVNIPDYCLQKAKLLGLHRSNLNGGKPNAEFLVSEVIDEVNIPEYCLQKAKLLGLHRSNLNGGKPNAEFLVRCSLTADEVRSLYKEGSQQEAYESEDIKFVPLGEALTAQTTHPELWNKMAPGAKGMLELYNLYRQRFLKD